MPIGNDNPKTTSKYVAGIEQGIYTQEATRSNSIAAGVGNDADVCATSKLTNWNQYSYSCPFATSAY
jgi:hypothetical protein